MCGVQKSCPPKQGLVFSCRRQSTACQHACKPSFYQPQFADAGLHAFHSLCNGKHSLPLQSASVSE